MNRFVNFVIIRDENFSGKKKFPNLFRIGHENIRILCFRLHVKIAIGFSTKEMKRRKNNFRLNGNHFRHEPTLRWPANQSSNDAREHTARVRRART